MEQPHATLFNRETAKQQISDNLSQQLNVLQDVANYGSNLIVRAFVSSDRNMPAIITCYVFLKQVVSMVDAVEVLLSQGAGHAAHLAARSAFEASLYIDYILEGDSELRANRFYVADIREQQRWARMLVSGTSEAAALDELRKSIDAGSLSGDPVHSATAAAMLSESDRVLGQKGLAEIVTQFEAARGRRKYDVQWYSLDGLANARQLAKYLNRLAEYEIFYSRGSQVMHTGTYKDHVRFVDGQVHATPIRHVLDFSHLVHHVLIVALHSYRRVVERYRSGEVNALAEYYRKNWQQAMLQPPKINHEFTPTSPM